MQEYLELALAEPDIAAYNEDILPIDDISDHPPLAGCIKHNGAVINFISWNIMHGKINTPVREKIYRSLTYYMNKLLDIGGLDLILLQEAKHTSAWKYINEDKLGATPRGANRNWKCMYNNVLGGGLPQTRDGLAIYYNEHSLLNKGYIIYPDDFANATGSDVSSKAHPAILALKNNNNKELTILNVHLNPPHDITTQIMIYEAIEHFVNENNTLAIIGDSNMKYDSRNPTTYSRLVRMPFDGWNMTVEQFIKMNHNGSMEINSAEDNKMTKAVLIYNKINNDTIIKYRITDKYNYHPDSTLKGLTEGLSVREKSKYQRINSTPFKPRDLHNLTQRLNSDKYTSKRDTRKRKKEELQIQAYRAIEQEKRAYKAASGVKNKKKKRYKSKTKKPRRKYS